MNTNINTEQLQKDAVDIFNQDSPVRNLSSMQSASILKWIFQMKRLQ